LGEYHLSTRPTLVRWHQHSGGSRTHDRAGCGFGRRGSWP